MSQEALLLPGGHCAVQETLLSYLSLFSRLLTFWSAVYLQGWVNSAVRRQEQEDPEFQASWSYIVRPCLKKVCLFQCDIGFPNTALWKDEGSSNI